MALIQSHYWQALTSGGLTFGFPVSLVVLVAGTVLLFGMAVLAYRRTSRPLSRRWRSAFISLRAASLLLIGFLLLEPGVLVSEVRPQETYIAVLVDDSQSMSIRDKPNLPARHEQLHELLYGREHLLARLADTFQVRSYRFSDLAQRLRGAEDLQQQGGRTALARSIEQVRSELVGFPLAAMVVITDGADNDQTDPLKVIEHWGEDAPPVFTVGIGAPDIDRDISITSLSVNRAQLENSVYQVHVGLSQRGYQGQSAKISVAGVEGTVAEETIKLPDEGTIYRHTLEIEPKAQEVLLYQLSVEEKTGETIVQNNHHDFFVDNRRKPPLDILYVEGQPRNEYKFIRRAAAGDESIRLATYLQTGPRKFLRQGIRSPQELAEGFPSREDELFQYAGVILGNVDRSLLSDGQLELLQQFVARRGGGLLQLGGVDESLMDSPLADILPVELRREAELPSYLQGGPRLGDHPTGREFMVRLTGEGEYSPILRLNSRSDINRERWNKLPPLQGIYVVGRPKPGATVLMEHSDLRLHDHPLPLLSMQRYGAGRSMLLATTSSWRWQMMMPHDDDSHEHIWRQTLRWLASDAPKRLDVRLDREHYTRGEKVVVTAHLLDREFHPDNDGLLWLQIKKPDGDIDEQAMSWVLEKDGAYGYSFVVEQEGIYDLSVRAPGEVEAELQATAALLVAPSRREFVNAGMDESLLKRLAADTGGRFYTAANVHRLVDDIAFAPNPYSKMEVHSLWDQPLFFVLLVIFLAAEWLLRRVKGLS